MPRSVFRSPVVPAATITAAATVISSVVTNVAGSSYVAAQAKFVFGSGGTNVNVYVQTSLDGGVTWIDIMNLQFLVASATKVSAVVGSVAVTAGTAPTDGTLAANTVLNGLLGDRFRVKYISTGTYAGGTTLQVDLVGKD